MVDNGIANNGAPAAGRNVIPAVVSGVLALGALGLAAAVAIVLLLSDRAPRFGAQVKEFILQIGMSFESVFNVDWIDRDTVPGTFDQIGHAFLWGGVMVLLGLAFRRWVPALVTAFFVGCASITLEVLQGSLTSTRSVDAGDAFANGIGIAVGLLLVLVVGLVFDVVAKVRKRLASMGDSHSIRDQTRARFEGSD